MFVSDEQEELCYKKPGLTSRKTLPQRGPRSGLCGQQMSQQRKVKAKILFSFSILNTSGHQVWRGGGLGGVGCSYAKQFSPHNLSQF